MYTVRFSKKAEKAFKKIDFVMQKRVYSKMKNLEGNPRSGPNIKTMQGFVNRFRYRVEISGLSIFNGDASFIAL